MVQIDTSDSALKAYWEAHKQDYLTPRSWEVEYIEQGPVTAAADEAALRKYYDAHKHDFTDAEGKLLPFEEAKSAVQAALDDKATNKAALKTYIAYKKGKLAPDTPKKTATVSEKETPFSTGTMQAIAEASELQPFIKPKKEEGRYVIVKLLKVVAPRPMDFEAARPMVLADYTRAESSTKLIEMAKAEVKDFKGKTTEGYLKRDSTEGIEGLDADETRELLNAIFQNAKSRGLAGLKTHKMVLYHIVDQKIEAPADDMGIEQAVLQSKTALLNNGLIRELSKRYETKIFLEGFAQ
jgi:peptidyl-prolyl cis-trans isomerase D